MMKLPIVQSHQSALSTNQCSGWICFSGQDWWYHNRAHSDFQLMRRIAQHRPVLFINSIGMRMPKAGRTTEAGRRILRKARSILHFMRQPIEDTPNFYVVTPLILPFYESPLLRAINAHVVRTQVQVLALKIGIKQADAIIFLTVPTAWEVVLGLSRRALLYNRSDLHSAFEETDQSYIRELESSLLRRSDGVLYASHELMDSEKDIVMDRAFFLDHGVDFDRFACVDGAEPADLALIPHPRIGFFGGIDDYVVDLSLIKKVALGNPHASVVLVGDATCPMGDLQRLSNVYWLGFKPYNQIPTYGRGFDVAIMPWLRNKWIQHSNPIKLKEYLALGLPIVSTDFPEVHYYADVIAIAKDDEHFVHLVHNAVCEQGDTHSCKAMRQGRVSGLTWDKQAELLMRFAESLLGTCAE